jgi:hypothetical protein
VSNAAKLQKVRAVTSKKDGKIQIEDASAEALLNIAREYHDVAQHLLAASDRRDAETRGVNDRRLSDTRPYSNPINFLYFHAVELCLKAFLRLHLTPINGTWRAKGHPLVRLCRECKTIGLHISPDDRLTLDNVVGLLESGNRSQGFRYFNIGLTFVPDLDWTREVASALLHAVEAIVEKRRDRSDRAPAKVVITLGKPRPKEGC